jgi:hypothetical protein
LGRFAHRAAVHRAVPRQQDIGRKCLDALERGEGALAVGVEHRGQQLGTPYPGGGVTTDQGVAGDQDPGVRQKVDAVPRRVAGRVHRNGTAGQIQRPVLGERLGPGHPDVGRATGPDGVHRPGQHAGAPCLAHHLPHAHLLEELAARVRHFRLVQVDRDAERGAQVLGGTQVVVVRVRDEHGADGLGRVTEGVERREELLTVAGVARVDQGDGVAFGQHDPVRVAAVHQMNSGGCLDDRILAHDHPDA